jgi:hypothetical protein
MDETYDPLGTPGTPIRNKQSKYFQLLQSNSPSPSIKPTKTKLIPSDLSPLDIDSTPPLRSPFNKSHRLSSSSSIISPINDDCINDSLTSSTNTFVIPNVPYKQPSSNRFVSSSSSPKSQKSTSSPTRRFSKNRLNNVENINYSYEFNKTPIIPSPKEKSFSFIQNDFDNLLFESDTQFSFFKQNMMSPIDSNYPTDQSGIFDSPTSISKTISQTSLSLKRKSIPIIDLNNLPLDMQIILNSRPESNFHDLVSFTNQSYAEFWKLTAEEGKIYKEWNKLEFDIQSLIFEIFTNLKKIRFNLHRLIFIYGLELKDTGVLSSIDYDKTFEVLSDFYYYLDKLITKKLKLLFDDHFFVNDTKVLKLLNNWFKQLNSQYRHISGSVVFLSKFSSNEDIRELILGISKKDLENQSNRSAVSPIELFNSYFIKLFTSIALLFDRIKSVYKNTKNFKNFELANNLHSIVKQINNISDSTSDLQKKINFNEKLSFNSEIDYSRFQMVDIFNESRKSKEPIKLEIKNNLNWSNCLIAAFDNYLTIFSFKSNTISLNKKDEYSLLKPPIPIQYLQFETFIEHTYKIIIIKDIGNKQSYTFRKVNDVTIAILDKFLKDLINLQLEFWNNISINSKINLKILNMNSFVSKSENYHPFNLNVIPDEFNLLKNKILMNSEIDNIPPAFEPILCDVLCCDYFTYKFNLKSEKLCIIGTSFGIFIGKINNSQSFRKVHQINHVKKLQVLNNEIVICISNESLYKLSIKKLYETYKFELPPCDINVFDENKRYITDFTIGYQSSISHSGCPHLFAWNNKLVNYTELRKSKNWKFSWQSFKTQHNILTLKTVYANNFAVGHIIDNYATWNLSKLSDIRAVGLNQLDIRDILKNDIPIAIFPFPNQTENISEILVVYSKFCTRMKIFKGKYIQSTDEVIWFGMKCDDASFDCEEKVLITVNKQVVEIRCLFDDYKLKSRLIGCLTGVNISLINDMPGKAILKAHESQGKDEYKRQIIFKIKSKDLVTN